MFGGTTILVPEGWDIKIKVVSILGGFSDKHKGKISDKENTNDNKLVIKGLVIFGGGEIKSF
jgi:hypothetical protein